MIVFEPGEVPIQHHNVDTVPEAAALQEIVGGWIEAVPGFYSIQVDGKHHRCVAFCNEDGKRDDLRFNANATISWEAALRRNDPPASLVKPNKTLRDTLVGPVVVVFGDDEFMADL